MTFIQLQGALELGLIYSLVSIGVYLSFRVLQFPDLTVDGSFPLGAAVCASLMTKGVNPGIAVFFAIVAGGFFGWVTSFLANYLKLLNLLAGILTMSALYSINLRVLGNKPNLSLLGETTTFVSLAQSFPSLFSQPLVALLLMVIGVSSLVVWFLGSHLGLAIRATGTNSRMARSQGIDDRKMIAIGLSISNACVALSGALFAQIFGFADVSLGVGTIIIGLASVIIGETVMSTRTVFLGIVASILGAVFYRVLIAVALNMGDFGLQMSDLNLITAVLVVIAMSLPRIKKIKGFVKTLKAG